MPCIKALASEKGRLYGLCHAAGIVETRPLSTFNRASFQAMLDVNFTAGIELARAVTRRDVIVPEGGSVLLISSIYSHIGMPGQIGYSATKGALQAAARAMAMELARRRIRVNTIAPGMVLTPMTDTALARLPRKPLLTNSERPIRSVSGHLRTWPVRRAFFARSGQSMDDRHRTRHRWRLYRPMMPQALPQYLRRSSYTDGDAIRP